MEPQTVPLSEDLQVLTKQFLKELEIVTEREVDNVYEFLSQNPVKNGEDYVTEEDFLSYLAEVTDLPILTHRHLHPSAGLIRRCQALGFPVLEMGYIPVLEQGPGIFLAHFDP